MLKRLGLPLILLTLLAGSLMPVGSQGNVEERLARVEKMLRGEETVELLSVKEIRANLVTLAQPGGSTGMVVRPASITIGPAAMAQCGNNLICMTQAYRGKPTLHIMREGVLIDEPDVGYFHLETEVLRILKRETGVAVSLSVEDGIPKVVVADETGYKTVIGVNETVSKDGTQHKTTAANVLFYNPEGNVIGEVP